MQIFPTRMCKVTAWSHSRLLAHWLMTQFSGNCSVSYLSLAMVAVWAELNGGENSLHWKANMLPLLVLWLCAFTTVMLMNALLLTEEEESQILVKFFQLHRSYDLIPTSAKLVIFDTSLQVKKVSVQFLVILTRIICLSDSLFFFFCRTFIFFTYSLIFFAMAIYPFFHRHNLVN